MAEINYKDNVLELTDDTPVTFIREQAVASRFMYTCQLHVPGADQMWQFDYQGKARDAKYPDIRHALEYTVWEIWTDGKTKPGLVTREQPKRDLKPYEYMLEKRVSPGNVQVIVTHG